jgi:hypothetical protein
MTINMREVVWFRILGHSWEQIASTVRSTVMEVQRLVIHRTAEWLGIHDELSKVVEKQIETDALTKMQKLSTQGDAKSQFNALSVALRHILEMEKLRSRAATNQARLRTETLRHEQKMASFSERNENKSDAKPAIESPKLPQTPNTPKTLTSFLPAVS